MEYLILIAVFLGVIYLVYLLKRNKKDEPIEYVPLEEKILNDEEEEVFSLINEYRVNLGFKTLITDKFISRECESHVVYCILDGKASHDSFPKRYAKIKQSLPTDMISEIVSSGFHTPDAVVNGFKNSMRHHHVLIGDYTHMGISVNKDINGKLYTCIINVKIRKNE
jgi:uncharacterized protein YkwD